MRLSRQSKDNLNLQTASVTPVRGAWCSSQRHQTPDLDFGPVRTSINQFKTGEALTTNSAEHYAFSKSGNERSNNLAQKNTSNLRRPFN